MEQTSALAGRERPGDALHDVEGGDAGTGGPVVGLLRRARRGRGKPCRSAGVRSTTTSTLTSRPGRWWGNGRARPRRLDGDGRRRASCGRCWRPVTRRPAAALGSRVRATVGPRVRRDVLGAEVGVGAVGAHPGSVGAGRGPRRPRRRRRRRARLVRSATVRSPAGAPTASHQVDTGRDHRRAVPSAHVADDGPSAAHPRHHLRQGPGPDRDVVVARRPVPEVPAAHHRLDLRRRAARRAHRPGSASTGSGTSRGRAGRSGRASPGRSGSVFSERSEQVDAKLAELIGGGARSTTAPTPTLARSPCSSGEPSRRLDPARLHGVDAADAARRVASSQAIGCRIRPRPRSPPPAPPDRRPSVAFDDGTRIVDAALPRVSGGVGDLAARPTSPATSPPSSRPTQPWTPPSSSRESTGSPRSPIGRCLALGPDRAGRTVRRDGPAGQRSSHRPALHHPGPSCDQEHALQDWASASIDSDRVHPTPIRRSRRPQRSPAHDRLVLVVGPAGTGKTRTTARAVRQPPQRRAGRWSGSLPRARPPTSSPRGRLPGRHARQVPRPATAAAHLAGRTTVILDEAGMAATADLAGSSTSPEPNRWRLVCRRRPRAAPRRRPGRGVRPLVRHPPRTTASTSPAGSTSPGKPTPASMLRRR